MESTTKAVRALSCARSRHTLRQITPISQLHFHSQTR
jgi:hypothetical protein